MRILIFGDSIVQGDFDSELGGWASRLKLYFMQKLNYVNGENVPSVYCLGINGDTSSDVASRIKNEIVCRRWLDERMVVIVAVGIGDSVLQKGKPRVDSKIYQKNLSKIFGITKGLGCKLIFIGLTSVNDSECNPISWDRSLSCSNDLIWKYELVLRRFCDENRLPLIKLFEDFQAQNRKSDLLEDGIHPNNNGHYWIFEHISNALALEEELSTF